MDLEKYDEALNEISDEHIAESAKKRLVWRKSWWIVAVAAVLTVAIGVSTLHAPTATSGALVVAAPCAIADHPSQSHYITYGEWLDAESAWRRQIAERRPIVVAAMEGLTPFFSDASHLMLNDGQDNALWSPVNAYLGLAMLAEIADGNSRQQILDLLGADTIDTLRQQVKAVSEVCYHNSDNGVCTVGNSLWLENGLSCRQDTLDILSNAYYASVFRDDLGSPDVNQAIGQWLNNHTGNLLQEYTSQVRLSQETLVALYSTLYYHSSWMTRFDPQQNTEGIFHAPSGDKVVTYMNQTSYDTAYYEGEDFQAIILTLCDDSKMFFLLPKAEKSTTDLLKDDSLMQFVMYRKGASPRSGKVQMSIPKFDVSNKKAMTPILQQLGVTDVFTTDANFSALTGDAQLLVNAVNQYARVKIDEDGVTAAAYIEIFLAGGMPPEEIIDFVLDRPFLFAITRNDVPLFAGVVNEP